MTDVPPLIARAVGVLLVWCLGYVYGQYRYERRTLNRSLQEIFCND